VNNFYRELTVTSRVCGLWVNKNRSAWRFEANKKCVLHLSESGKAFQADEPACPNALLSTVGLTPRKRQ